MMRNQPIPTIPAGMLATMLFAVGAGFGPAMACEPSTFDFDLYLADHDKNKDGNLQQHELLAADSGLRDHRYGNVLDRALNTKVAFATLDANRDSRLSKEELWQWGEYVRNTCAGWHGSAHR